MNPSEAAQLLAIMAAYDNRTVGKVQAVAWAEALPDVSFTDARQAVTELQRTPTDWIKPYMILAEVKRLRSARLMGVEQIVPACDPDDVPAYLAQVRAIRAQVASGEREIPEPLPGKPLPSAEPGLSSLGQSLAGLRFAREVS